jgi:hypothetical protein
MASRLAILATAKAIRRLLEDACPKTEFPSALFRVFQAADLAAPSPMAEGISIYLYLVTANASRRNMPARLSPSGKKTRPPLPLDLHFMLTSWSANADMQLRLLGWAMRVLDDTPILPAGYLNDEFPNNEIFCPEETVELIFNPLSLQDMAPLWENLHQQKLLPSVTYVARLVTLDSEVEMGEHPHVQTRVLDMAKGPP